MNFNSLKAAYFLGLTSKFTLFFVWQREYQMLLANENFFPILAGKFHSAVMIVGVNWQVLASSLIYSSHQ